MEIEAGTRVGKYEIQSLVGEGGMGLVYRALDTELRRPVALKFLPAEVAADPRRLERFGREALAASALNHPNIVTVYDIGQTADGRRFFATEFVDGATLRAHTKEHRLKLVEALDLVAQVAAALVEAHGQGIVHRDIKPENVMVRRDGYVKVLDFGLAKLTGGPAANSVDTEAATRALSPTGAGTVLGTVSYMSPEQARGEEVDARTDVWSLGVVLYEMLTGHLPFRGKSASHTIVAIQDEEPPPLSNYLPDVPDLLQEIVADALAKDREARLTTRQMLAKLQRLKRRVDAGAHLDHSVPHGPSSPGMEVTGGRLAAASHPGSTASGAHATQVGAGTTQPTSPGVAAPAVARRAWLFAGLGALVLAGLAFAVYRLVRGGPPAADARASMQVRSLTDSGRASEAVISPDGRWVAYVSADGARQSIHLRQVVEPSDKEIVPAAPETHYRGLTFSPDGNYLYYLAAAGGGPAGDLYRVPLLGGAPRGLNHDVDSAVSFSPDGRRFAFVRDDAKTKDSAVVVSESDGTGERALVVYKAPEAARSPAWAPDGESVAYALYGEDRDGYYTHVAEARVADGRESVISSARWRSILGLAWLPDRSALLLAGRDRASAPGTPAQIWQVAYPSGEPRQLTNDSNQFDSLSLTADGKTLAATRSELRSNVWVVTGGDYAGARQVTTGRENGNNGCAWTPDGRLVYTSRASGYFDIWVMNADGGSPKQLTFGTDANNYPSVSPDGRSVVFETNRGVGWSIWRMNADGGAPKELTRNSGQYSFPQVSADGRWVFYSGPDASGRQVPWRVPLDGGQPEQLTRRETGPAALSPDGGLLLYYYRESPDAPAKIELAPSAGGEPVRVIDPPGNTHDAGWMPDGRALVVVRDADNVSNLWTLPLEGGKPRPLTDWKSDKILWFAFSRDGRQLAVARGDTFYDVMLIKDFR
ncbi:MAG: PD40 domain-containing protein [Acidobacteria bacterium]|nr:PD40 domain-containing protein [Acidobacteriota bacterium]